MSGKGDMPRPVDAARYARNYTKIDWTKKSTGDKVHESVTLFDFPSYRCPICKDRGKVYTMGKAASCSCQL